MALRKILMEGDPLLRKKCRVVEKFDGRLAALFDDLKETLSAVEGLGLAAPQVGVLKRAALIVYDDKIFEVVNPEISGNARRVRRRRGVP